MIAEYRKQVAGYRTEITTEKTKIENYIEQLHRVGFELDAKLGVVDKMLGRMDDMDDKERKKSAYSSLAWKVRAAAFVSRLDDIDNANTVSTVTEPETMSVSSTEGDDLESQDDLDLSDSDIGSEYEHDSSDDDSEDEDTDTDDAPNVQQMPAIQVECDSSDHYSDDYEPTAPIISSHQLPDRLEYSSSDDSDQEEDLVDFIVEDSIKVEADDLADIDTSPPPAKRTRQARKFFHNQVFTKGSGWAIRGVFDATCRDM